MAVDYARNILEDILGDSLGSSVVYNSSPDKGCTALKDFKKVAELGNPTTMLVDNQAAIYIGMHDTSSKRSRHINVRFNLVRDMIYEKLITLKYINTKEQLADILTKCLSRPAFEKLRDSLLA